MRCIMSNTNTAKIFKNGRSQAVRLPSVYRFDRDEVYIRRDEESGDIILSERPGSWSDFFELVDAMDLPAEFMQERNNELPQDRELFK